MWWACFTGADVLRLAEQRADCAENRGTKKKKITQPHHHQAACQGLEGINPSNVAGDRGGQEGCPAVE